MKLKQYPKYKESGVQWIEKIPEDWISNKIKHNVLPLEKSGLEASEGNEEGEYPFFTSSQIQNKFIDKAVFNNECLILGTGGMACIHYINGNFSVSTDCLVLKKQKNISVKYMYYQILSNIQVIDDLGFWGMGLRHLQKDFFYNMLVYWPTKEEQQKISSFLDSKTSHLNQTIEADKKLIDLLKEKRTALINHVVTKGLNPKAKMKDSGIEWIGEVPEGWEVSRLKFLVSKINSGVTPTGGARVYTDEGVPLIRSQNVHFDGLRLDDVAYIPPEISNTMLNAVVKRHDVLINITGASIGRCSYVEDEFEKANVNQHVCIIRTKKINYKYLAYYLMSQIGQDQVFSVQMGTSREGLNFQQLGDFIIFCPSIDEQRIAVEYIESKTNTIYQIIKKIEEKITLMEEYKSSLIHHVVTGKVDVRGQSHEQS